MRRKRKNLSIRLKLMRLLNGFRVAIFVRAILVVTVLALSVFVFQIIQRELNGLQMLTLANTKAIDVQLIQKDNKTRASLADDVKVFMRQTLLKQKRLTLTTLSRLIQREFSAQQVSLVSIDGQEIHVRLQPRQAVFAIGEASYLRLSDQGEIFKEAYNPSSDFVVLYGILPTEALKLRYNDEGCVILDTAKKQGARTAIELLDAMRREGFDYTQFHYIAFRGFALSGSQKYPQIMIGDSNFTERFARLRSLLKKSAGSTQIATKIELDYDDKAFVQEKAL